jgi:DNA-binding SARP family transcriptional activator
MDKQVSSIKKTTRPILPNVILRKRLFRLLDQRQHFSVTWISGIAGSGKTTLAASYLDTRELPCIWYQFDERDKDPATFFYYLGNAVKKAVRKKFEDLPLFTSEYYRGASAFSRQYFELLCARLNPPFFLVFDDFHSVPLNTPFHEVFKTGIAEIIPGVHIMVLSRNDPPPAFAGLLADNTMRIIGKNDLLMNRDESRQMLQNQSAGKITRDWAEYLYQKTKGWVAGLILMVMSLEDETFSHDIIDSETPERIFDYFAGELFDTSDTDMKDFLIQTAFLPKMTAAMADVLTGRDDAGKMLASLERNYIFTERFSSSPPTYHYHPLFRDFLLSIAGNRLLPKEVDTIRRTAARILADSGYIEDAVELYMDASDFSGIIPMIEVYAEELIEQGRNSIIEQWIAFIPEEVLETSPWTLYWFAASCRHTFPSKARATFVRAFHAFNERRNMSGLYLSWSGIVESTIYEWNNFTVLDPWIEWMEGHLLENNGYPSPEIEARIAVSMLCALMFRKPDSADMIRWVEQALLMAKKYGDVRLRSESWDWAITYYCWLGNFARAEILKTENRKQMQAYVKNPAVMLHLKWLDIATEMFYGVPGESTLEEIIQALHKGEETGIHAWDPMFLTEGVYAALILGKTGQAEDFLKLIESLLNPSAYHGYAMYHISFSLHSLLTGDTVRALEHALRANEAAEETGYIFPIIICRFGLAQILLEREEYTKAGKEFDRAHDLSIKARSRILEFMCLAANARLYLKQGIKEKGRKFLHRALSLGRKNNFQNMIWWWQPAMITDIVTEALSAGIEVPYARELVRTHNINVQPPPYHIAAWPWPLKINTLGLFEILRDDKPVKLAGRAFRKPLYLLKAIIAYGNPEVNINKVTDAFWPDSDGDQAHSAFSTTLNRLRSLLDLKGTIRLRDGILMIDESICRVDARVFTDFIGKADQLWEQGEKKQSVAVYEKATACYSGNFLEHESDIAWAMPYRERLKRFFIKAILRLGLFREKQYEFDKALSLYYRGLAMEQTNEALYQRSMICCSRLGRNIEIEKIYRRCRDAMKREFDVNPSRKTADVFKETRRTAQ